MDSSRSTLDPEERGRLEALRSARSLADLLELTGAATEHEAYFAAKAEWATLRGRELAGESGERAGLPGNRVVVDGHTFHVHGVTHADTDPERAFLREHVSRFTERGATVYTEQGIRPMYFGDFEAVCAMDDYRWALARCRELDVDSHVSDLVEGDLAGLAERVDDVAARFREAAFSLVDSGREVYGDRFARALGDVASDLLVSHEGLATGDGFESFELTRAAAEDPGRLAELQAYYERAFLPQPLEREWLRGHDPELELVTHARNERMADYALAHNEESEEVHLVIGAAHGPGVTYYLERVRDGDRTVGSVDPVG